MRLFTSTSPSPCTSFVYFLAFTTALFIQYAFAAREGSISSKDDRYPRSNDGIELDVGDNSETYEPEFAGADRSIIGRAGEAIPQLKNNVPGSLNINQSASQYWTFPRATFSGQSSPQMPGLPSYFAGQNLSVTPDAPGEIELYISLTTCRQPLANHPDPDSAPDQLKLYISTSSANQQPNETNSDYAVVLDGGFGWLNISVKNDVYFGVFAPKTDGYDGVYNYQLTASTDGFYASLYNDSVVRFIDSDTNSALLYTTNTTNTTDSSDPVFQQWMDRSPIFSLFVQNQANPSILGLQNSVCGLQNLAQIQNPSDIETNMTAAGDGKPKQQFYVKNLNSSSTYYAILAMKGNSTDDVVGGGGIVWNSTKIINTKTFDNCALLFNLSFCTSVAYAAPANPLIFNTTKLGQRYDEYAKSLYQNFSYSLQVIPCNTTSSAQYSLARNCNDCDAAYRQWLCAVTIPRCEDLSNPASYLQPRALGQNFINPSYEVGVDEELINPDNRTRAKLAFTSSRNPMIDDVIKPGPYKELLPCEDMCYNLTRSCPAALGFNCPIEGHGLGYSYGKPQTGCNSPWMSANGSVRTSGVAGMRVTVSVIIRVALASALVAMVS